MYVCVFPGCFMFISRIAQTFVGACVLRSLETRHGSVLEGKGVYIGVGG